MTKHTTSQTQHSIAVPVAGLTIFAIASGYLMSLLPLSLTSFQISTGLANWLASIYYIGLLIGSMMIESVIRRIGHRVSFIGFLSLLALSVAIMPLFPSPEIWLLARFIAGMAVAGIFVVIESWLLIGDSKEERAKNLGLYMTALYGGTAIGQFGIGTIGAEGAMPFIAILALLIFATIPALLGKNAQPPCDTHHSLSIEQVLRLSKPAIIGCLVSGIVMGTIYGLMPLALKGTTANSEQIGVMMAATVLGGMVIQPIVSKLSCLMSKSLLMALACLIGVFAMGIFNLSDHYLTHAAMLALMGMSAFALYPIAITLACDELNANYIVSATQVMLFSYSVGSASGPMLAYQFMAEKAGLMDFFFLVLLATAIYMLLVSAKRKPSVLAS
ncbi:MFS transporter [Photobacterium sp. SDRW27]|uniref:MFS transporter n=1 Tax=Photobacterium obscurum TaxID=2829490 RepID=UPI002243012F|nr:MFS transporter [Photobacterium obscurum]MCW8330212.1 MFS transporter [Photobacterium obscurum]